MSLYKYILKMYILIRKVSLDFIFLIYSEKKNDFTEFLEKGFISTIGENYDFTVNGRYFVKLIY